MSNKNKDVRFHNLLQIKPVTDNQKAAFNAYKEKKNLFLYGAAGTGKTFISLYLALKDALNPETTQECVYLVRSAVPTREIGFLPGDEEDKTALFQVPYQNMVQFMFEQPNEQAFNMLYDRLKNQGSLMFMTTSFLRGITLEKWLDKQPSQTILSSYIIGLNKNGILQLIKIASRTFIFGVSI